MQHVAQCLLFSMLHNHLWPAPLPKAADPGRVGGLTARFPPGLLLLANSEGDILGTKDLRGMSSARRDDTVRER